MASTRLLVALCVVALFAVRSESHGLEDFTGGGSAEATPAMQTFFKPEAAALPEALDASMPAATTMAAKPEASAIPTTTTTTTAGAATGTTASTASAPARRSVSVAAGVACGVAAVAVVGIAAAVAYVVRGRRGAAVQLGSSP
ncbi:uncharacterized protein LOC120683196 [Panicum virgatum]|uniref:Uncharacterized protein n=1 Tax=Panicum virgatum TaxID=38727 RepID=A0A8T0QDG3_PANVG|nr:uncharacterized protein LOC120683196 [Panicum virgatum]XP_039821156.1 uncharacterized protein LOC120683196 [Panicum virgatum]XP_039821157.1 uncharacterized protein LOC120683196 [Panicum virgatum]KAG2568846.1 hypothetical protein PVAP13_7NG397100 [Panicum virgatum]